MERLSFGALIRVWGISALIVTGLLVIATTTNALSPGQDMQNMPGMKMPKSKSKATRKAAPKKRRLARKRRPTKQHDMSSMPGMNVSAQPSPSPKQSVAPQPSPQQMQTNMPGMQMPQASPSASPQTQINMRGMQTPKASPTPPASPEQKMNMPMPGASPSPGEIGGTKGMEDMPGMGTTNTGQLLVMSGNDMGVRVGLSETNVMYVG